MLHLVTGGSGFLGSSIVRLLVERGEKARVLDLWRPDDLPEGVEFVRGDVTDQATVEHAMRGITHVHHAAGLVPLDKAGKRFWKVNVEGTRIALSEAGKQDVRMFCHMSSSAVFGLVSSLPVGDQTPRKPVEAYGASKKAAEDLVMEAAREGRPVSIVRPRTIIGPGRLGLFEILFGWIRDGSNVYLIGDGGHLSQFVHVDDVAEASIRICRKELRGTFNLGTDRYSTLRKDLEALCSHAGTRSKIVGLPVPLARWALLLLDKLQLSPCAPYHYLTFQQPYYFDSTDAFERLGFKPRFGNVEMLQQAYDWFVAQGRRGSDHSMAMAMTMGSAIGSAHRLPTRQKLLRLLGRVR